MSKTNLSRRKPRFVAETISARRGRCALCALVRVREVDLLVAIGARSIERKAEFGLCRIPKSLVTHRLYHAHYIARSMACWHVGACKRHFRGDSGFKSRLQTRRRPGPAGALDLITWSFNVSEVVPFLHAVEKI